MSKAPLVLTRRETRCPICGALFNLEECNPSTHAGHTARKAEREIIVKRIREFALGYQGRERDLVREVADAVEVEGE